MPHNYIVIARIALAIIGRSNVKEGIGSQRVVSLASLGSPIILLGQHSGNDATKEGSYVH